MGELTYAAVILRILTAVILGGIIGRERGLKNRPAGLRTYMLVCMGAAVVMLINQYACQVYGTGDPLRLGAQVVSGIGFLGAGTIIVTSHNQIRGLTTAAGLWASACIGLAVGIGLYPVALTAGLAEYVVLTVLHNLDFRLRKKTRVVDLYIELTEEGSMGAFLRLAREQELALSNFQKEEDQSFLVTAQGPGGAEQILKAVRRFPGVGYTEML